ncbi:hypothetical protein, partial [Methylobacter sp.]
CIKPIIISQCFCCYNRVSSIYDPFIDVQSFVYEDANLQSSRISSDDVGHILGGLVFVRGVGISTT